LRIFHNGLYGAIFRVSVQVARSRKRRFPDRPGDYFLYEELTHAGFAVQQSIPAPYHRDAGGLRLVGGQAFVAGRVQRRLRAPS